MHHAVLVESASNNRCQSTPVGVSRRPLRSSNRLLLRARPPPGRQPILHWGTTSRAGQSLRTRSMSGLFPGLWPFSTPAFALAFFLEFFNGPSCFLRLRPRLAVARRILSLPLTSRGSFLGPLTLFHFSFALTLRNRVERFEKSARSLCELFGRSRCRSLLRSPLPRSPTSPL